MGDYNASGKEAGGKQEWFTAHNHLVPVSAIRLSKATV